MDATVGRLFEVNVNTGKVSHLTSFFNSKGFHFLNVSMLMEWCFAIVFLFICFLIGLLALHALTLFFVLFFQFARMLLWDQIAPYISRRAPSGKLCVRLAVRLAVLLVTTYLFFCSA